jgi:purine-binding chemotaxis protein CheW
MQIAAESDGRETVLVFRLGDEEYGLPIAAVDEIVRLPDTLTRVPRAPGFVHGVMNFRGKALPVIDQRQRFGVAGTSRGRRRVIVTTLGNRQAGFVVDSVSELLAVPADQVTATPDLAAEGDLLFDRVVTLAVDGRMILLVDPQQLLNRAERDLLAALETPDAGVVAS